MYGEGESRRGAANPILPSHRYTVDHGQRKLRGALVSVVDLKISTVLKIRDSLGRDHGPDNVTVLLQSLFAFRQRSERCATYVTKTGHSRTVDDNNRFSQRGTFNVIPTPDQRRLAAIWG